MANWLKLIVQDKGTIKIKLKKLISEDFVGKYTAFKFVECYWRLATCGWL